MFDYAALERRVAALEANRGASLRFGTVTGVDEKGGSVRVQLPDGDGMVSGPLRVMQSRSLKDKPQCLPDVGEPVACLFAGQGMEAGVVLGAHYSTRTPAPGQPPLLDYMRYEDGTEIWYDREAHLLKINVMGNIEINATGDMAVACGGTLSLDASHIAMQERGEK